MGARRGPPAPLTRVLARAVRPGLFTIEFPFRVPVSGEFPYGRRSKVGSRPLHFLCVPVARTPTRPRAPAAGAPARGTGGRPMRPTCATGSRPVVDPRPGVPRVRPGPRRIVIQTIIEAHHFPLTRNALRDVGCSPGL